MLLGYHGGGGQRFAKARPRFQPSFQPLEGRELKDGAVALVAGTLTIAGTAAQNYVTVAYSNSSRNAIVVDYNDNLYQFNTSSVSAIQFTTQGAFNVFDNYTNVSSTAQGGDGFNIFEGVSGNDTFIGGNGTNYFEVQGNDNTLEGGNGFNVFFNVTAGDSVTVGTGTNYIF